MQVGRSPPRLQLSAKHLRKLGRLRFGPPSHARRCDPSGAAPRSISTPWIDQDHMHRRDQPLSHIVAEDGAPSREAQAQRSRTHARGSVIPLTVLDSSSLVILVSMPPPGARESFGKASYNSCRMNCEIDQPGAWQASSLPGCRSAWKGMAPSVRTRRPNIAGVDIN